MWGFHKCLAVIIDSGCEELLYLPGISIVIMELFPESWESSRCFWWEFAKVGEHRCHLTEEKMSC